MKVLWMGVLGVSIAAVAVAEAPPNEVPVRDKEGKSIAVIIDCNDCRSAEKKGCRGGAEDGWRNGTPCGQCLLKANADTRFMYYSDLHFTGRLVDEAGKPVKDRFVKMFMANGWNIRTRTDAEGHYRLMVGAIERQTGGPIVVDLGTRTDLMKGKDDLHYAFYFMAPGYTACAAGDAPKAAESAPKAKTDAEGKTPK